MMAVYTVCMLMLSLCRLDMLKFKKGLLSWRNTPQWARAPSLSMLHDHTQHSVGLLWTRDQLVAETSDYTQLSQQTSMPLAGFEPAIPASERPQTHALDRAATGIFKGNMN